MLYSLNLQPAVQRANAAAAARIVAADGQLAVANAAAAAAFAAAVATNPAQANAAYQAALDAASATRNEAARASFEQLRSDVSTIDRVLAVIGPAEGWADPAGPYLAVAGCANAAVKALATKGYVVAGDVYALREGSI